MQFQFFVEKAQNVGEEEEEENIYALGCLGVVGSWEGKISGIIEFGALNEWMNEWMKETKDLGTHNWFECWFYSYEIEEWWQTHLWGRSQLIFACMKSVNNDDFIGGEELRRKEEKTIVKEESGWDQDQTRAKL